MFVGLPASAFASWTAASSIVSHNVSPCGVVTRSTHQHCCSGKLFGQCSPYRSRYAHGRVAAQVSHQVPPHERGRKGLEREARGLYGTGRQDHRTVGGNGNKLLSCVVLEFDGVDHSIAVVKIDHVRAWDEEKLPLGIRIYRGLTDGVCENGRAAVFVERKKTHRGRSLDGEWRNFDTIDRRHFLRGRVHCLFQSVIEIAADKVRCGIHS